MNDFPGFKRESIAADAEYDRMLAVVRDDTLNRGAADAMRLAMKARDKMTKARRLGDGTDESRLATMALVGCLTVIQSANKKVIDEQEATEETESRARPPHVLERDGVLYPAAYTFEAINEFIHHSALHFEELQGVALDLALRLTDAQLVDEAIVRLDWSTSGINTRFEHPSGQELINIDRERIEDPWILTPHQREKLKAYIAAKIEQPENQPVQE